MKRPGVQQALLRPAFVHFYPGIRANEWQPVAVMMKLVRAGRQQAGRPLPPVEPELNPEHFRLRGTASAASKQASREGRNKRGTPDHST